MKTIIFLLSLIFTSNAEAQKKSKVLEPITDSTTVLGIIIENTYYTEDYYDCQQSRFNELKPGTIVIIGSVSICSDKVNYYGAYFKDKYCYIPKEKVKVIDPRTFETLKNFDSAQSSKFLEHAYKMTGVQKEVYASRILDFISKCKSKGLVILTWSLYDESEYTQGTGVNIEVHNPTDKTIKYLWFTFQAYNAVDDKISSPKAVKGIGPIEKDKSASYNYTYVWFTDLAETAIITSVKVQYMDGSFKIISNPREITMSKEMYEELTNN